MLPFEKSGTLEVCSDCGSELLQGLCPKCLLRPAALAPENANESEKPPRRIGDYEIIAELGRGAMGVVFRARQLSLNRAVALKMILKGEFASEQEIQRFRDEAEAGGSLEHPNILPVFEVGQQEQWHYFSMRLIEGQSLDRRLNGNALAPRDAAALLATIADAVHHAHQHGVLHRDLKPANILLDEAGVPYVADFGLAKQLARGTGATKSGAIVGTPDYMSPEQASGRSKRLTTASDIYSLGAILFEMLTGRTPFKGTSTLDMLKRVVEQEPERLRSLNPSLPRDLEAICMKCLEKDPSKRYTSARALGEDLRRFLNGESVSAVRRNVLTRMRRVFEHSYYDEQFHQWGTMLIVFGMVILVGHVATFVLIHTSQKEFTLWLSRGLQLVLETFFFWYFKPKRLEKTNAAERQLWSIWLGFLIAYVANVLACRGLLHYAFLERGVSAPTYWTELVLYPINSVLAGLAFFIMGGSHWGRCYQFGVAYFLLAVFMPMALSWAPLMFGVLTCSVLVMFGLHLRRLARGA